MELTSEEDIQVILDGALKSSRDVSLISYRLLCNSPNGFNGLYYTILIKYSLKNNDASTAELSCFAKAVPPNEHHIAYIRGSKLVHKENEFYLKLVPTFRKFITFELPVPDCYFIRFDELNFARTLSVMEDLQVQGFVMRDKLIFMNEKELSLVVSALAKLHAASIITVQKSDIRLSTFCQHPDEALWTLDEQNPAYKWLQSSIDTLIDVAKRREKFVHRISKPGAEQKVTAAFERTRSMLQTSKEFFNCICHGDIWNNNLMFRYSQVEEPLAVRIIDMQVYRLAPPVTDLLMFIFLNSSRQVRAQVMDRLISEYWQALEQLLGEAACRLPPEMADLGALKSLLQEFWLVGLVAAGGYVPMCQMPPGAREKNVPQAGEGQHDFDVVDDFLKSRGEPVLRGMNISEIFKENVENVMEDLFDFCGI